MASVALVLNQGSNKLYGTHNQYVAVIRDQEKFDKEVANVKEVWGI